MLDKEVERVAKNPGAISLYRQAIGLLEQAQVLHLLRCLGRPQRTMSSSAEYMVQEGAHSSGWQDCLDTLINLEELILHPFQNKGAVLPEANYGALKTLYEKGDITKEEYEYRKSQRAGAGANRTTTDSSTGTAK